MAAFLFANSRYQERGEVDGDVIFSFVFMLLLGAGVLEVLHSFRERKTQSRLPTAHQPTAPRARRPNRPRSGDSRPVMDEVGAMDENGQDPDEVSWNTMLWSEEQLREIRRRLSDRGITHYMDEGDLVMAITVEPTAERIIDDVLSK